MYVCMYACMYVCMYVCIIYIHIETLKAGEDTISKTLAKLYSKCLSERRIPTAWKNVKMMIVFKKGNKKDLTNNYRPICLLSNIYKVLTKVLTKRLEKTLDENQPREQAGFRCRYSTTDHIHVVNQLKKCREYNTPLCIAFVDYEKSVDSVQTQAVQTSLQEHVYIDLLNKIYNNSSMTDHNTK